MPKKAQQPEEQPSRKQLANGKKEPHGETRYDRTSKWHRPLEHGDQCHVTYKRAERQHLQDDACCACDTPEAKDIQQW